MSRRVYVASSWRNSTQPEIVEALRGAGHEVYDFRNPAPGNHGFAWSEIDPKWMQWTPEQFAAILNPPTHSVAALGYGYDKAGLDWCDTCVLVLPCGRSAHLEAGYAAGQGKQVLFFLQPDRFEPELMYLLGNGCVTKMAELIEALSTKAGQVPTLEQRIEQLLKNVAEERRSCRLCDAQLYMVRHWNKRLAPYTASGLNHFLDCPHADKFKRGKG
jgi:nucleoside 2-deoxyribosyltransferase